MVGCRSATHEPVDPKLSRNSGRRPNDSVGGTYAHTVPARVLVVDDEPMVREVVARYLELDGVSVAAASNGAEAIEWLESNTPDLIVLDVMMPEVDGLTILRRLRLTSDVPVILLTARSSESDRIAGLELGADDYVVKPFSPREVAARVRTILRRGRTQEAAVPQEFRADFDGLTIDASTREVRVGGAVVVLTPKEFDVLALLAQSPRQVFSRSQLLHLVWASSPDYQDPATVTVHVGRLRHKLEIDPQQPRWIHTVHGVGYRFEP
jgi:DNA-binding response OmpR family regulator